MLIALIFLEFVVGLIVWYSVVGTITKNMNYKEWKPQLIRFSPMIIYGVFGIASIGATVTYKNEGGLFLLGLLIDAVQLPVMIFAGVFVVPAQLGNYILSKAGFSELYEWNFFIVGFLDHFKNSI